MGADALHTLRDSFQAVGSSSDDDSTQGPTSDGVHGDEQIDADAAFTQGVDGNDSISSLTPAQIGALLTFVPPSKSHRMDQSVLTSMRKSMLKTLRVINNPTALAFTRIYRRV